MIDAYIAGTLGGRDKKTVIAERAKAVEPLRKANWRVYDPFENEAPQHDKIIAADTPIDTMRQYANKDLRHVRKSDVIFILTDDTPTDGTWDEKVTAWNQGSVVILVAPRRRAGEICSFSNVRSHYLAESIEDAVKWAIDHVYESPDGGLYVRGNVWPR